MEARMTSPANPDVITAIQHLYKAIHAGGADGHLLALVHLRASQINGCGPCIFATVQAAKKAGETEGRLHNVVAWRETPFYTDEERAALTPTEAATRIQDGALGVIDEIWDAAVDHFSWPVCRLGLLGGWRSPRTRLAVTRAPPAGLRHCSPTPENRS
ncbi:carboxymuconolactone decarboxylase family protein [Streptomyces sp. NPDC057681]|uniref:carboxymuconolactone decarboxylase family protein n=1 Tax=Streptomyces sp. NPDC057681 TaxID=3346209 RepID=UPI0036A0FFA6